MKSNNIVFLFFFFTIGLFSQAPDWSVNASNFQYNMTVTAFLSVNGTTLMNANDKLGAFVNDEKRGEANVVFNANANKYLVYLTVYANVNGETINFKIYDSTNNQTVTIDKTFTFSINSNFGGVFQSESMANPSLAKDADFLNFNLKNINEISSVISTDEILIHLPQNTAIHNLIPEFTVSNNAKVFINQKSQVSGLETKDFTNDVVYQVLSEDESVVKIYTVKVSVSNSSGSFAATLSSSFNGFSKDKLFPVNLSFTTEFTDLTSTDFTVSNAYVKEISTQNNKDYVVELLALNQGEISLQLDENMVFDANNNSNDASNILKIIYDIEKPILKEVTIEQTSFLITFSEDVQNVSLSNFELAGLAKEGFEISTLEKRSNSTYLLKINDLETHTGNVYPVVLAQNIQDLAGNLLESQTFEEFVKTITLATNTYFEYGYVIVYPNPSSEEISIKLEEYLIKKITFYNLLGQAIKSIPVNKNELKIDISEFAKNIYFLEVLTSDNKRFVKKIIKN